MNDVPDGAELPIDWPAVPADVHQQAKTRALAALAFDGLRGVQHRLAAFYDVEGNYAGASFAYLEPNELPDITATDLHATSLLSVDIGPQATRRLLTPGATRQEVLRCLLRLPDTDLAGVNAPGLLAMESFYRSVKAALSLSSSKDPNPWVTASKLCARKRFDLFPVRDRNVCEHLGILRLDDYRKDWQVFRALIQDPDIRAAIDALPSLIRSAGPDRHVVLDSSNLRLLDAAIWTHTVWK